MRMMLRAATPPPLLLCPGEPVLFQLIEWLRDHVRTSDAVPRYGPIRRRKAVSLLNFIGELELYCGTGLTARTWKPCGDWHVQGYDVRSTMTETPSTPTTLEVIGQQTH
jgi:hypothetical protein